MPHTTSSELLQRLYLCAVPMLLLHCQAERVYTACILQPAWTSFPRAVPEGGAPQDSAEQNVPCLLLQAIVGQQEAALGDGSDLAKTSQQLEVVFSPHTC